MKITNILAEKGKLATLLGFFFAMPVNGWGIWKLYTGALVTVDQLWVIVILNSVSLFWFILPSEISIKSKAGLEIVVKD